MRAFAFVLLLLLLALPVKALELYMRRSIHADSERLVVGDLVLSPSGDGTGLLDRPLARIVHHPALIPSAEIRRTLAGNSGPLVITGGRVAVVPPSVAPEYRDFYTELLLYLDSVRPGRHRLEVEQVTAPRSGALETGGTPVFQAHDVGELTEVTWRSMRGQRGTFTIRIHEYDVSDTEDTGAHDGIAAGGTPAGVRSGDGVRIHFVRGVVTVTMPGRALRSGTVGDVVFVRANGSSDRFEARVTGAREVVVEIQ